MSDTPRTDTIVAGSSYPDSDDYENLADFARQLERENNDLRKLLEADKAFLCSKGFTTLTELLEDKKRLDWLQSNAFMLYRQRDPGDGILDGHFTSVAEDITPRRGNVCATVRESIDAARKATPCHQ